MPTDFASDTSQFTVWTSGANDTPVSYVVGFHSPINISKILVTFAQFSSYQKVTLQFFSSRDQVWRDLQYYAKDCMTSFGIADNSQ